MNVLTTTWRQLVRRRLWPVAVLLLAGLVAAPVLLSRDPAPVTPPEQPAAAPAEQSAKSDDAIAEPVVAKASSGDRARRRRVLGVRKDPFTPAIAKKKHTVKKVAKKPARSTTKESSTPVTSTPSTPVAPSVPSTPVAPAPKKKVYAKDSLIVRFGDATSELKRINLLKLGALPNDDELDALLIYTGLTDHGKKAVFLVDESLDPSGDGTCNPHPSNCETVELAKGETEFFEVTDPETGDVTAQYELDLVDIK
jgi:hypothetical protein